MKAPQAIIEHRKMWKWLSQNPRSTKRDYLDRYWEGVRPENECFLCEAVDSYVGIVADECAYCPVAWPGGASSWCIARTGDFHKGGGLLPNGLFQKYKNARKFQRWSLVRVYAEMISELPARWIDER